MDCATGVCVYDCLFGWGLSNETLLWLSQITAHAQRAADKLRAEQEVAAAKARAEAEAAKVRLRYYECDLHSILNVVIS